MTAFVSVVIPSHFRPDRLDTLLRSLTLQTYPAEQLEVVVVPTPDDATEQVIATWQAASALAIRSAPVPDDRTGGQDVSAKRNHGAREARGEWLAFIDDDCCADPRWIEEAAHFFPDAANAGVEGRTVIPQPEHPTLTSKGLRRLSRPGGFQTCNVFYRHTDFSRVGGFDQRFPWYLEDTDLAWSILDLGKNIPFAAKAIVSHPLKDAATWRLVHEGKGTILKPLLYKKHPTQYRERGMQALRLAYKVNLFLLVLVGLAAATSDLRLVSAALGVLLVTLVAHLAKQFWHCRFTLYEVASTGVYWLIVPPISLVQLIRGSLKNGLSFKDTMFLLK